MPKVGSIDDPVWMEDPPIVVRTSGARTGRRRWPYVAAALVGLALCAWWKLTPNGEASGDPGGTILRQLTPAATALPGYGTSQLPWSSEPSTSSPFLIKREPRMDSCDGIAGTQGWSQVVVQASFRWGGSHLALFASVGSGLGTLGWRRTPVPGRDEAMWKKRLASGDLATASLNLSPLGDPNWEFVALAPPAGRAARGC